MLTGVGGSGGTPLAVTGATGRLPPARDPPPAAERSAPDYRPAPKKIAANPADVACSFDPYAPMMKSS
jgi:hypothetical protein